MPFTSEHITSIAARAAELERIGEELLDPSALVRAARLYTLAVRIADDIDHRDALPFMLSDLARVREELRSLATDAGAPRATHDDGATSRRPIDSNGTITRMFREVAVRIEHRLAQVESR
jgi:hypothetical protein